jgi:hypothetical protein
MSVIKSTDPSSSSFFDEIGVANVTTFVPASFWLVSLFSGLLSFTFSFLGGFSDEGSATSIVSFVVSS